jgi:hypothetical protein
LLTLFRGGFTDYGKHLAARAVLFHTGDESDGTPCKKPPAPSAGKRSPSELKAAIGEAAVKFRIDGMRRKRLAVSPAG